MRALDLDCPCLRPVEAIPDPQNGRVILRDPTQLAAGLLVVGMTEFVLLTLLDGQRRRVEIQAEYARRFGQLLLNHELDGLLDQLSSAGFLAGPGFESYYGRLAEEYRLLPFRPLRDPNGLGAPAPELPAYLNGTLAAAEAAAGEQSPIAGSPLARGERLAGMVTPHLDYPRGAPCYGAGYHSARTSESPRRVVILGTNHFGRSRSVVATAKDFETPWGCVPNDRAFLERLQAECGGNLMPYELDHLREHSIELQVIWLHHLFGDGVRIVPFLCPDPGSPRGTEPGDPEGVDLREFARALGHLVRQDPEPTLLIASADLSHVGGYFGDKKRLEPSFLQAVREMDEAALAFIDRNDAEGYRSHMAQTGNPTRVCSVGCLYALMTALGPEARPHRLRYHQAVTAELDNCVTSTAYAFYA
jgi:MEMO1 family protein